MPKPYIKTEKWLSKSFWLSLILHILFLLSLSTVIVLQPEEQKPPHDYVPSYVYQGAIKPATQALPSHAAAPKTSEQKQQAEVNQQENKQPDIPSQTAEKHVPKPQKGSFAKSILASSLTALQQNQMQSIRSQVKNTDPILLIGEENEAADPLIKLVGRALSANFQYPRQEGMLGIEGRVLVELTLHPSGEFSDVRMVRSSNNQNLDAAALYAVNKAPTIYGADRFLSKPKHFVIGFVFYQGQR